MEVEMRMKGHEIIHAQLIHWTRISQNQWMKEVMSRWTIESRIQWIFCQSKLFWIFLWVVLEKNMWNVSNCGWLTWKTWFVLFCKRLRIKWCGTCLLRVTASLTLLELFQEHNSEVCNWFVSNYFMWVWVSHGLTAVALVNVPAQICVCSCWDQFILLCDLWPLELPLRSGRN